MYIVSYEKIYYSNFGLEETCPIDNMFSSASTEKKEDKLYSDLETDKSYATFRLKINRESIILYIIELMIRRVAISGHLGKKSTVQT